MGVLYVYMERRKWVRKNELRFGSAYRSSIDSSAPLQGGQNVDGK